MLRKPPPADSGESRLRIIVCNSGAEKRMNPCSLGRRFRPRSFDNRSRWNAPDCSHAVATVACCLLAVATAGSSQAEEAFRVYAPGSKTQTLWVVDAVPNGDGGLELKLAEKPELGIRGGVIAAHPKKPLLYISSFGGERGKVPGAVVTLSKNGSYEKHQTIAFNDDAAYLSLDRSHTFLTGVSYGNGRLNVYRLDENGVPGKAVATVD
jgi:hypothetical protein